MSLKARTPLSLEQAHAETCMLPVTAGLYCLGGKALASRAADVSSISDLPVRRSSGQVMAVTGKLVSKFDLQLLSQCGSTCQTPGVMGSAKGLVDLLVGPVVKASASREADLGSIPAFGVVLFRGRVMPVT